MLRIRTIRLALVLSILVASLAAPTSAFALATRTWVSGVGDDVNPCSRTAPCKTLAGAISKTAPGGEINAVDGGGFGAVTITKSITIDLRSEEGGILNAFTYGILISGTDIDVVIRGVDIHGAGASEPLPAPPACQYSASSQGIRILNAHSVRVEDATIASQAIAGVNVQTTAANVDVSLDHVDIQNSCGTGVNVAPTGGSSARVLIDHSTIVNAAVGINSAGASQVHVAHTTLFDNAIGLQASGGGTIAGQGDNLLIGNATPGAFTSDSDAPQAAPAPTVITNTVQTPTPLVAALALASISTKTGKPATARYAATTAATAKLEIRKAGKLVGAASGTAKKGANAITWNGKVAGKAAAPGTYVATLRLTGNGQTTTATATIVVTR